MVGGAVSAYEVLVVDVADRVSGGMKSGSESISTR
jgi:hypothetical protein